jgi:hypothetical protein
MKCFSNPEKYLWKTTTKDLEEVKSIFYSIQKLKYEDVPDYEYIKEQLNKLQEKLPSNGKIGADVQCPKMISTKVINKKKRSINLNQKEEENSKTKKIEGKRVITEPSRFIELGLFPCCDHCVRQAAQIVNLQINCEKQQSPEMPMYNLPYHVQPMIPSDAMYPVMNSSFSAFQTQLYQPQFSPFLQQGTQHRPTPFMYNQINDQGVLPQQVIPYQMQGQMLMPCIQQFPQYSMVPMQQYEKKEKSTKQAANKKEH